MSAGLAALVVLVWLAILIGLGAWRTRRVDA
jgi:hypothetical protein